MKRNSGKHGLADTALYSIWRNMISRCYKTTAKDYHNYGGRGIRVCEAWRSVTNFYTDNLHTYTAGLTLDRVDNDREYSPANCIWANRKAQAQKRRSNITVYLWGSTYNLKQALRILSISYDFFKYYRKKHKIINHDTAIIACIEKQNRERLGSYR
jgi:hypothetical protein